VLHPAVDDLHPWHEIAMYRRAGWLRIAAIQFVALTGCAMAAYAGGTWWDPTTSRYELAHNFLSDLGMTHTFSGRANYPASALFAFALASLGAALIAFAWTWRELGDRTRWGGHASALLGTAAGVGFVGVAFTPFDWSFALHNMFVIGGFGLLGCYTAAITYVMWRNGIRDGRVVANVAYLALLAGYGAHVAFGPTFATPDGHSHQVVAQKIVAYGSMIHVLYLATATRRALTASSLQPSPRS
jgi:hypothetical protein